jgi:looped-hinge helix DNA binding domain, AbrB family
MNIAIVRNIDKQGRVVIPSELRRTMQLVEGDLLEFTANGDKLQLRKYDRLSLDEETIQYHLDILFKTIHCSIAITSGENIIASRGFFIPVGTKISSELSQYIQTDTQVVLDKLMPATMLKNCNVNTIIPLGMNMCLLLLQKKRPVTDGERTAAQLTAALLSREEYGYA